MSGPTKCSQQRESPLSLLPGEHRITQLVIWWAFGDLCQTLVYLWLQNTHQSLSDSTTADGTGECGNVFHASGDGEHSLAPGDRLESEREGECIRELTNQYHQTINFYTLTAILLLKQVFSSQS